MFSILEEKKSVKLSRIAFYESANVGGVLMCILKLVKESEFDNYLPRVMDHYVSSHYINN